MNKLTTIAALPAGAGCKSALTADVQESPRAPDSTGIYAFEEGGLVRIGDVAPTPADRHGFEPFEYNERS